jgi:hypothetical protein
MMTFWPFGVIPTSTLLLPISSPLRLSGLKPTPSELLRYSAVCYLEHVTLLLCTVYAERRHELEEGRRSAAGAPFDFPISKEWRNGYDYIADHYLDYSPSWRRRLLWTRALVLSRDASRATSRSGGTTCRGYLAEDLHEQWRRYLCAREADNGFLWNFWFRWVLTIMHLRDEYWYLQRAAHCSRQASDATDPLERSGWASLQSHYVKLAKSVRRRRKPFAYEARPPSRTEEYRSHR